MTSDKQGPMLNQVKLPAVLACSVILLAGCSNETKPAKPTAEAGRVTIRAEGMTERFSLS